MFTFFGKIFTSIAIGVSSLFGLHTVAPEAVAPVGTSTQATTAVSESSTGVYSHPTTSASPVSNPMQNTPVHVTAPPAQPQNATQSQKVEPVSRVQETPIVQAPKVRITANPSTVEYGGTSAISWVAADALSCTLGSSPVLLAVTGSQSVSPTNTDWSESNKTTYAVTCTGAGGSVSGEASVTVRPWAPSTECKKAAEGTPTVKGYELNPTLCSKLTI